MFIATRALGIKLTSRLSTLRAWYLASGNAAAFPLLKGQREACYLNIKAIHKRVKTLMRYDLKEQDLKCVINLNNSVLGNLRDFQKG